MQVTAQFAPPAAVTGAAGEGNASGGMRFGMHNATVVSYLVIAAIVLAPGLLLALLPELTTGIGLVDAPLRALRHALQDIRFWVGPRFWFGVSGLTLMVLLLAYPLRKALARHRWLGSVGGWFHMHLAFGVAGPVLILYHCNFGLGGTDANVALWSMLAVAASGIVGHFVYANASATFYEMKQAARRELDAVGAVLLHLSAQESGRVRIQAALDALDTELWAPRQGIIASFRAQRELRQRYDTLRHDIGRHLQLGADELGLGSSELERYRMSAGRNLAAYIGVTQHAARRSLREQLWARWRLFHLPAFLIMLLAAGLHVAAVWKLDDRAALQSTRTAQIGPPRSDKTKVAPVKRQKPDAQGQTQKRQKRDEPAVVQRPSVPDVKSGVAPETKQPVPVLKAEPVPVRRPAVADARPATSPPASAPSAIAPAKTVKTIDVAREKANAAPQQPAVLPIPAAAPSSGVTSSAAAPAVPQAPSPFSVATNEDLAGLQRRFDKPAAQQTASRQSQPVAAAPNDEVAELQRRFDEAPMSLGGARKRTLVEQIAELKAKMKTRQFTHALDETGFALTGQHVKQDCLGCHTAPFPEPIKASEQPRACVNCHKKDDVHRGRRQNCASCHTTKNWTEIIR